MDEERREEKDFGADVLCGANSYNEKYYFNEKFANLPQAVKDELHVMCVLYTEECGGILTLEFLADGTLVSPPLEDLAPFLPREELEKIMIVPMIE